MENRNLELQYRDGCLVITGDLCLQLNRCTQSVNFLNRFFPDGVTTEDAQKGIARHIPMSFMLDAYHFFPITDKDKSIYLEYLKIEDTKNFFRCHHVKGCRVIEESHHCKNSTVVHDSSDIEDSSEVYNSSDVISSTSVFESFGIDGSSHIQKSNHIKNSRYIYESNHISDSDYIFSCKQITKSYGLRDCEEVSNSMFCSQLAKQNNKIFCTGENPKNDHMIFNKLVSERMFLSIFDELANTLIEYNFKRMGESLPSLVLFAELFDKNLWSTIKERISFYDPELAYKITLSPHSL